MNIISKESPKQYGKIKEVSCDSKGVSWSLRVDNGKQTGPSLASMYLLSPSERGQPSLHISFSFSVYSFHSL